METTEKEKKDLLIKNSINDFFSWLLNKNSDANIWDLLSTLEEDFDQEYLKHIFPSDIQRQFILGLVTCVVRMIDFHDDDWEDSHSKQMKTIRDSIDKLKAQFRNHRHDYTKSYTGRAEY